MGQAPSISFPYGNRQRFRYRYEDINVIGSVDTDEEIDVSNYSLNNGPPVHLYVEPKPSDKKYPWNTNTPGVHRLRNHLGWFNIEIPIDAPQLLTGQNVIDVEIQDRGGAVHRGQMSFNWDPVPVQLPLILDDFRGVSTVQEIGQAVNGVFAIDAGNNCIRTVAPSASDSLFLLGSPNESQEATYDVTFKKLNGVFVGLSDFFVRHDLEDANLGIKPGYSTNGLATLRPDGAAEAWLARGDCLIDKDWAWLVKTQVAPIVKIKENKTYRVRHQAIHDGGVSHVRFRIWEKGNEEPDRWLLHENNGVIESDLRRTELSTFGLFKYSGGETQWSNIELRLLDVGLLDLNEPVESARLSERLSWIKSKARSLFRA